MHIYTYIYTYAISPLQVPHWGFNQQLFENIQKKKFPESFTKQLKFTAH